MSRERRVDYRHATAAKVKVEWTDSHSRTETAFAQIADLSRSGARLLVTKPIQMPAIVTLTLSQSERKCQVRYCVKAIGGFSVGVRFCE